MQFFWLPSFIAENPAPPCEWRQVVVANSLADVPSEGAAVILEIGCEADSERAADFLEQAPRSIPVWIYDPAASVGSSVAWMKFGAAHVVTRVDDPELALDLIDTDAIGIEREAFGIERDALGIKRDAIGMGTAGRHRNDAAGDQSPIEPESPRNASSTMIGDSRCMRDIQAAIRMVGDRHCSVLIEGETGTGKEVVAREIHAAGARSRGPWVAVNCSAIPEPLLEAELFGYLKGAFTGAQQSRAGKFEAANHGTIFLDEIGDMPIGIQAKLLRVLQEREIERLGGNERVRLNIRVIAASNVDLAARVQEGRFRQDLFYRLNVFQMKLPSPGNGRTMTSRYSRVIL